MLYWRGIDQQIAKAENAVAGKAGVMRNRYVRLAGAVRSVIGNTTGWSIKRFVTTARRYRTIEIQAGQHTITAADSIPEDLQAALDTIHGTH